MGTLGNLIWWIVLGGLAGWIASMIMGTNRQQGLLMDIVVGIVGAIIGGYLVSLVGLGTGGFIWSLLVAVLGAVILLWIMRMVRGRA
ncbi:MAG: GlsB/YeaQ/YmgE family stress response membrane protein [Anaerolineae bacterium]|nr:GlsB/YeaQ/YmgE family stress response membrane protein [Anaerolineae bacterium]